MVLREVENDDTDFSAALQKFVGTWKQTSSENLSAFLEAEGVSWMKRKVALQVKPVDTITINEKNTITIGYTAVGVISGSNTYIINGITKIRNFHGEEVDAECIIEKDEIILTVRGGKAGTVRIVRKISGKQLLVEQTVVEKNVTAKRIFEFQPNSNQIQKCVTSEVNTVRNHQAL